MLKLDSCTRGVNKSWFPGLYSPYKNERIAREVLTHHGFQDYTRHTKKLDWTRGVDKSWFPGLYSPSRTRLARQVLTNPGFQDYHRSTKMREFHEGCQQIMVSRTIILARQTYENCTRGVKKSRLPGLHPQCANEGIARGVLINHGFQGCTHYAKNEIIVR